MTVPAKSRWKAAAGSGDPQRAVDGQYATVWSGKPDKQAWLEIDLGEVATLGGLEVYWGKLSATAYAFSASLDGKTWTPLCRTRHGEGGQDVFAFPPTPARHVRWSCEAAPPDEGLEIVEINLYAPDEAARVLESGRIEALGRGPVTLPSGESITVDFGVVRYPLGALIEWGASHGKVFSVHLSDDGETFREVGRIATGDGGSDSFWWRFTMSRFFRLTVHETSTPEGAVVNELKLRLLNKDRMPIGQLERAAERSRKDLYPQSLLGRQVYWTALGEADQKEQALFDEYGALEPRRGFAQLMPLVRVGGALRGPAKARVRHRLAEGSLPAPTVAWSSRGLAVEATALAADSAARVEYRIVNRGGARAAALVLALRPVQVNPYWQHGGHAAVNAIAVDGARLLVNDRVYAVFSRKPDAVAVADFDGGDVVRLIDNGPCETPTSLRSVSGLLSAACEFAFSLEPGESAAVVVSAPMRDGVEPKAAPDFATVRDAVVRKWRKTIGPRKISVGDKEIGDTVEAQTALILVNSTRHAFKPGPRNYDRTWIRDGSSQALALLWAGLADEAKAYVLWYAERVYPDGMVPPILNVDGSVNRGYGSDIEYDAQGEFVGVAADVYRITRDRDFLGKIFEPALRATRFVETLRARTNASCGPESPLHGLLAPSISHEGYSKPSYSYWDDFFALSAFTNCAYLADEIGDADVGAWARAKAREFGGDLARSILLTSDKMGKGLIAASGDREDVDPTSTSIAFEPCRVEDVLPRQYIGATYDLVAGRIRRAVEPGFEGNDTPYAVRNLNAFVALGRFDDALRLLSAVLAWRRPAGWRGWAEVVWGDPRAPEYIGDMPHTWIGAEFATAVRRMLIRENGDTLELFRAVPDGWWSGRGIALSALPTAFGVANLRARRRRGKATVDLALAGPQPARTTIRYPGARAALADGRPCAIDDAVISAPNFRRLEIDVSPVD
jgi:hypothetical protein